MEIYGSIVADADQLAIRLRGVDSWVKLQQAAEVTGRIAVLGAQSTLVNFTDITADGTLLVLGGIRTNCYNVGTMTAEKLVVDMRNGENAEFGNEGGRVESISGTAIIAHGSSTVYNTENGIIAAALNAVRFDTEADERSLFRNGSTVTAGKYAFLGGDGRDQVVNSGSMTGNVALGAGNDVFEAGMSQSLEGTVFGGKGDDMLVISSDYLRASGARSDAPTFESSQFVELAGGGRHDTTKSMFDWTLGDGFEDLVLIGKRDIDGIGNAASNTILGNSGDNTLSGAAGDDVLTGGEGADTFVFSDAFGKDRIVDFNADDFIDLRGLTSVESYEDLVQNHMHRVDRDVVISAGDDQLVIVGEKLMNLGEGDFRFAQ